MDFKRYHYAVVDLANEESLPEEQALLDNHNMRVSELLDCVQELETGTETVSPKRLAMDPSQRLYK